MKIRQETGADAPFIEHLTWQAFLDHPHHAPGAKPTEHQIVNRLRACGGLVLSLVAQDERGIVGHIAFSAVTVNGVHAGWFGLAPVSVIPARQGQGIGSLLIADGIQRLREQGAQGIVLLGEPDYYGRFGFKPYPGLTLPGVPAGYFLALPLNDAAHAAVQGEVAFHPALDG